MKLYRNKYNIIDFDYQYDNSKILSDLDIINHRLRSFFDNLHLACVIIRKDDNGNYILVDFNKKAEEINNIHQQSISKKLIDLYPDFTKISKYFDECLNENKPINYKINIKNGYRNSNIYKICDNEIVVLYEDIYNTT